jgi:fumarate hydratase class II
LSPRISYLKAAEIAKESMERKVSVRELAIQGGLITREEADEIFNPDTMPRSKYE